MALYIGPNVSQTQFSGCYGNAAVATGTYVANNAQPNDTVYLLKLFAGSKISNCRLVNAALGAGTSLNLGFLYADGAPNSNLTQFFANQNTAAAASQFSGTIPFTLTDDAYIVATFLGGACTGEIDVVINYEFIGQ